jgi:hypothetical protein
LNAYDATLPAPLFDLGTDDVVIGGWPTGAVCSGTAPPLYGTKSDWAEHGNMTATDALLASPGARILDIRISSPNCCDFCFSAGCGVLSNALAGYAWAIDVGKPDVLSNSWGVFRLTDAMDYASQPSHWFNRKVDEALAAGIAVLFAAGNTGEDAVFCPPCPVPAAPGTSPCQDTNAPFPTPIFGANGKPEVITVGGVSAKLGDFVSYSTPGPALLADVNQPVLSLKPDLLAPTHYNGYWGGVRPFLSGLPFLTADAGTSAACPIAAGVVALIREAAPTAGQDQIKACLKITASPLGTPDPSFVDLPWGGHNRYEGAGAIAPLAAFMKATADCNQNQISDIEDVAAGTSNDFDQNAVPDECDPLSVDTPTVPVTGGAQKLTLNGGAPWSGFFYILFFGFKGTFPGLPIGTKTLPLNQPNLLTFGSLGPMGDATVTFFVPPGLDSSLIGVKIHNAYAVATPGPIEVSNATPLAITAP